MQNESGAKIQVAPGMYVSKQTWCVTTTSVRVVASVCLNATLMFADGSEVNGIRMCTVSGAPDQVE